MNAAETPPEHAVATSPQQADVDVANAERARIASVFEVLAGTGGPLDPWGPTASVNDPSMFAPNPTHGLPPMPLSARLRIYRDIQEPPEGARLVDPPRGGVLLTAGAPGAGKTYALNKQRLLSGSRLIDPDAIKGRLLQRLYEANDPWLMTAVRQVEAAIQAKVSPLEMSAVVHDESTALAVVAFQEALATSERVCLAGTCANEEYLRRLLRQVRDAGRERCEVLVVEVDVDVAVARSHDRWRTGREEFERGVRPMGERYVPERQVRSSFVGGTSSAVLTLKKVMANPEPGIQLVLLTN